MKPPWTAPGSQGFWNWVNEVKPKVLTASNEYKVFAPTDKQRETIEDVLACDEIGKFLHSISLFIEPRRHGKSTLFALIVLWLFTSRKNLTIQLLGNTEDHSRRVQYRTLKRIIQNTPKLSRLVPDDDILIHEIRYPKMGNLVQLMAGTSTATAFGDKINILWVSDFHASPDLGPWNALQAALLDSDDSLVFIDSNVDANDGHVHALQQEAGNDESIFCTHTHYKDFEDFCSNAPPWINRQKAKRLEKTTLPADFSRDILGKRLDAKNALFPSDVIALCQSKYKIPVTDLSELTRGRAYKVGGGLDRSKSLFGGDNTVWTTILKVASPEHGEPEIYVLNQKVIVPNTSRMIKKTILSDHERYNLDNVVLENYEVTDIQPWLFDQKIPCELISAHDTNQNASFPEFYRIAKEGRLHFPESLTGLESEMKTFTYTQKTGGKYSFGHASQSTRMTVCIRLTGLSLP
jgi:hypothetical protein